jgi:hypothetical protein
VVRPSLPTLAALCFEALISQSTSYPVRPKDFRIRGAGSVAPTASRLCSTNEYFALALWYEDLNDHKKMHHDPALQTVAGRDVELAGASTLCRFENSVDRKALWKMSALLVDVFIESHKTPPSEIVLDFDSTDDRVHGEQDQRAAALPFHRSNELQQVVA